MSYLIDDFENISSWVIFGFFGTLNQDSDKVIGNYSGKVITTFDFTNGGFICGYKDFPSIKDFSNFDKIIFYAKKVSGIRNVNIQIRLYTTDWGNNFFITPLIVLTDSWSKYTVEKSDFGFSGNPNWTNIKGVTLDFSAGTGGTSSGDYYLIDYLYAGGITEDIYPDVYNKFTILGMDKLISGTIRKSPNSANTCELLFHNPSGEKTYKFKHGDNIKLYAGLGYAYREPLFDGYIYDIYKDASPSNLPIKINCLDYIGKLQEERILLNETTNYDGWENVSAIRDIVTNCTGSFFTNFAVSGTSASANMGNIQTITSENNIRSDYESRLDVIKKINGFTYDDSSYPNAPKLYYFWQENDYDDTTGEVRRFCFKKITSNAGDMTAVKTLDYGNTIFDSSLREQTQGCMNTAIVKGTDCVFNHSDSTGIYNFLDGVQAQKIEDNTLVNPDDCQSKAVRFVELFKRPQKSIQVRCRDGFMLKPMDIVRVVNPRYGINENFFVIDVDVSFSSTEINTVLTLGVQRPYITSYL